MGVDISGAAAPPGPWSGPELGELVVPPGGPSAPPEPTQPTRHLRRRLVLGDVVAALLAWVPALALGLGLGRERALLLVPASVATTVAAIHLGGLYRSRVSAARAAELARLAPAAVAGAAPMLVVADLAGRPLPLLPAATVAAVQFALLVLVRSAFDAWLRSRRLAGEHCRPVVLVGATEEEVSHVHQLLVDHPELGYRAVDLVGGTGPLGGPAPVPWLGPVEQAVAAVRRSGANGALVCRDGLRSATLARLVRELSAAGAHVQVTGGLWGLDHRRLRSVSIGHEPFVYVEPPRRLHPLQRAAKRATDVVVGAVALLLALPVLAAAALAIRLTDGGPVLFHQDRVGRHGRTFRLLKLRTMAVDAGSRRDEVAGANGREGPLFKAATADPRVTRVGRVLRATSIDELPQLVNVLRGEMSLVGPRPALPEEAAQFDEELRQRHRVRPGITGLWQVEARDNPSFRPYRRLDLFYVENCSLGLDLAILVLTVQVVVARGLAGVRSRAAELRSPVSRP